MQTGEGADDGDPRISFPTSFSFIFIAYFCAVCIALLLVVAGRGSSSSSGMEKVLCKYATSRVV